MQLLYKAGGTLSKDFIGQISYTVCLDREYEELDIEFSFDKQKYTAADVTEDMVRELTDYCRSNYGLELPPGADPVTEIVENAKTEIHTLAMLNDKFMGCVHRQLTNRHMHFCSSSATEGCLPQPDLQGVLKVTILVFNVLMDDTNYTLQVSAR